MTKSFLYLLLVGLLFQTVPSLAQRSMERLSRGVVAVRTSQNQVFVSWRLLINDPDNVAFNVYRTGKGSQPVKLNQRPLTGGTYFVDTSAKFRQDAVYSVRAVAGKTELKPEGSYTLSASATSPYLTIPLQTPADYTPNDASAADLDGDGTYELILHQASRGRDNSHKGFSDPPILEAYKLDGTLLWRINLGRNIREGAHYTQFMVYDLDGDGRAELACKTADGTIDGQGKVLGDSTKHWAKTDGPLEGKILDGPEFFTIFDGKTGAALATTDYIPSRYPTNGWGGVGGIGGNDNNGNRVDRFLACVAYLDGELPSVVMCRGYYGRTVLAAWDWRGGKLTSRWVFDSQQAPDGFSGMGNHNLTVTDVDNDGKDEIIYGSMCVNDNGKGLYTTKLRHGDALHVSDLDPARPGLEVWGIHENEAPIPGYEKGFGAALYDARTGEILWGAFPGEDVGRGVAEDIDPTNPGAELWWSGSNGLFTTKGKRIGDSPSSANFLVWWDGDLIRELLDGNHVDKYQANGPAIRLLTADSCSSNNGTKATPALSADLFGDWREEIVLRSNDNKSLRIYTTTIPTQHRLVTLMQDPQYRLSIAWQNVGYNQPPHPSFFLGQSMKQPPRPTYRFPTTNQLNR
ncbi:rhamnogalacturonan lyase [Spirosoma sp. BT702]|uniref:Rhamnogalacturonan lyase n=1 Tax=Spirosoma profusum TaxID=2771354 RepID=A0A927AVZ6_9BACT|nr:rhamnogalacturonan lyase [Spirosoma profusum]MBD2705468.1 rhamnogalacturonan lyase [Spirosoma profusum]